MILFYYDDTFEGLLSAVFDAYTLRKFPDTIIGADNLPPLTTREVHRVDTLRHKADRVFAALAKRLSRTGKNTLLLAFLSEQEHAPMLLFRYIRKVLDSASSPETDFSDNDILAVDQLAKKVYGESHLLEGFVRFQKTDAGVYFAVIGPKFNVLTLLLPHFKKRFSVHPWVIYDAKRGYGFFHDNGNLSEVSLDPALVANGELAAHLWAKDEPAFQKMWKSYFAAAAIPERTNLKLQARCMPRHFWPYMTEMRPHP